MNKSNSLSVEEVDTQKIYQYIDIYTNIIYYNFIELANRSDVVHTKEDIHKLLLSDDMYGYIVRFANKIVGYLFGEFTTLSDGRNVYYLSYIYIAPKYRQYKIGSVLVQKLIDKCNNRGIMFIVLTCDTHDTRVMHFYQKFGFIQDPVLKRNVSIQDSCLSMTSTNNIMNTINGYNNVQHDVLCLYL